MSIANILIIDYHSASNRGDAAILEGIIYALNLAFPDAKINIITQYPLAANLINGLKAYRNNVYPFTGWFTKKTVALVYLLICALLLRKTSFKMPLFDKIVEKLFLSPFLEADLIVSTGGSFLNDFYYPSNIARFWNLLFGKFLGKKVIICGQSIGPLSYKFLRLLSKFTFLKIDCIILRDKKSFDILNSIGVKENVYVLPDFAFLLPSALNEKKPLSFLRLESIPDINKNSLNVSISVRKWSYIKQNIYEKYIKTLVEYCEWLLQEKKANVFFISTCTSFCGYQIDDRFVAYDIISRLKDPKNVYVLCGEYTPYELRNLFSNMTFHVGTRMHSCILALLSGVPVIGIGYEFKTQELMKQLNFESFVLTMQDIDLEILKKMSNEILNNRENLTRHIERHINELQKSLLSIIEILQRIC